LQPELVAQFGNHHLLNNDFPLGINDFEAGSVELGTCGVEVSLTGGEVFGENSECVFDLLIGGEERVEVGCGSGSLGSHGVSVGPQAFDLVGLSAHARRQEQRKKCHAEAGEKETGETSHERLRSRGG